jgi:hypothetical protein
MTTRTRHLGLISRSPVMAWSQDPVGDVLIGLLLALESWKTSKSSG